MHVEVRHVEARPTLVVAAVVTWAQFPVLWRAMSDEVWACLRAADIDRGARNVMLYHDDRPWVEVGVLAPGTVPLTGRVVASALPVGRVATARHRGPYGLLGDTHEAVHAWCRQHGEQPTRTRWEIYAPHDDDPEEIWVEVSWLLLSAAT